MTAPPSHLPREYRLGRRGQLGAAGVAGFCIHGIFVAVLFGWWDVVILWACVGIIAWAWIDASLTAEFKPDDTEADDPE